MSLSRKITKYITDYGNGESLGSRLRVKRITPLLDMIRTVFKDKGYVEIIDIGGTRTYWQVVTPEFLEKHKVHITIVNLPGDDLPEDKGPFSYREGDGCDLAEYEDQVFDIAHSNSVIEHVGNWSQVQSFASELKRVSKHYFVQTPNFWFPIEPHCMTPFFHWLPKAARMWLVAHFELGHWSRAGSKEEAREIVDSARLIKRTTFSSLFPDAQIQTEWFWLLPKSLMAIK